MAASSYDPRHIAGRRTSLSRPGMTVKKNVSAAPAFALGGIHTAAQGDAGREEMMFGLLVC